MPLVRITLVRGYGSEFKAAISRSVHGALMAAFAIPNDDLFQVIEEVEPDNLVFPAAYLGERHANAMIFVQIIAKQGRSQAMKKALYQQIVQRIAKSTGHSATDVLITLVENRESDWSFGSGVTQLLDA